MSKKAVVGQLAELTWKNDGDNTCWEYCVVEHVFDDRLQLRMESGRRYMHVLEYENETEKDMIHNQPTKSNLILLYKDGIPVMAKKTFFTRKYIIKPAY
ncbi:hypothetical protein [Priestia megaterium]|uniref:hypothetical protein n=1 Tax=Priestia megaterium TaxID=1404 RepID=UPI002877287D|nr:hypothetical protein [Priestia megaterium]